MRKLITICLSLFFLCSLSGNLGGQDDFFQRQEIITDREVSFRGVLGKGEDGFLWIGSTEGLCRFDGQRARFYRNDPNDSTSINDNDVRAVLPVGNKIWVGTSKGAAVLDVATHQFKNYQMVSDELIQNKEGRNNLIQYLFQDRQGILWAGSKYYGLWQYNEQSDSFSTVGLDSYPVLQPAMYSPREVLSITQSIDNDSIIWASTGAGLLELNKVSGGIQFHTFPQEDKKYQAEVNLIRRIYHHAPDQLFNSGWVTSIKVYNPTTNLLSELEVRDPITSLMTKGGVTSFYRVSPSQFWVTTGTGLFLYSTAEKRVLNFKPTDLKREVHAGIELIDEQNRFWHATYRGLFLSDPHLQQFQLFSFEPLTKEGKVTFLFRMDYDESTDRIIVGPSNTDGLYIFDRKRGQWSVNRFKNMRQYVNNTSLFKIVGFGCIRPNEYMLSGEEGIFSYNLQEGLLRPFVTDTSLSKVRWTQLLIDRNDQLWVGSRSHGLFRFDLATGAYEVFKEEVKYEENAPSLMLSEYEDSRGNIWIRRSGGVSVYLTNRDTFLNFIYKEQPERNISAVVAFIEDENSKLWVVASNGQMGYFDVNQPEEGLIKKMDGRKYGIKGEFIDLSMDSKQNVWAVTDREIFQIKADGSIASLFSFNNVGKFIDPFGVIFLPDDQMVIGGRREIHLVYPGQLSGNKELPKPYITRITVRQKTAFPHYPHLGGKAIYLKHSDNYFSISYAAQAYTMGKNVTYRYRLDGLEDWVKAESGLVANYTNVPAGNYTFQLMAINNEGLENPDLLEIPITIGQAWYKSWWFYLGITLFIALAVYFIFTYRVNTIRKEEKLKTNYEKKLAGVEMSALVAQMNPHFLFNSLNSIDSYIIKNESIKASEYLNNFARLMRLILQNSRSNYISLNDEIEGLELYLQMESMRFTKLFEYNISVDPAINVHQIEIPPMLIQPFLENAIWHGLAHLERPTPGKISLHFAKKGEQLVITVEDNGIGRENAAELRKNRSIKHKQSMGMKITESRIEMINKLYDANASIIITDLYDGDGAASGTRIVLTIAI